MRDPMLLSGIILVGVLVATIETAPVAPSDTPVPFPTAAHPDPAALERALLEATRAFMRADVSGARTALDRIEKGCRRLSPEESPAYPEALIEYDRAFHLALDGARELAGRRSLEESWDQFVWIQRGCRVCHGLAEKSGVTGTPRPSGEQKSAPLSSSSPADNGSPSRRSGSRPSR